MSTAPAAVVVVGDVMTDVLARLPAHVAHAGDTTASVRLTGGGSAANVAAWLAALGRPVWLVGRVGDDLAGRLQAAELAAGGVRAALAVDPDRPTGCCLLLLDAAGERSMLPDRGANLALTATDLPPEPFRPGGHLHVSGYTLLHPGPRPAALAALARAAAAGMTVSVNAATAAPLREVGAGRFLDWTAAVDLLVMNTDEADVLGGELAARRRAGARVPAVVVVTRGAAGAEWHDPEGVASAPAAAVATVADTVGAGDAFCAGLLDSWLAGAAVPAVLAAAAATAARCVAVPGGRPRVPRAGVAAGSPG